MLVIIEDYNGNDLCSFEAFEIKDFKNCDIADIDENEDGIKYMRLQINKKEDRKFSLTNKKNSKKFTIKRKNYAEAKYWLINHLDLSEEWTIKEIK
tara:strand:- start:202 stop:489 length:288 start_codon:yes stop_codon:yes gene_type:complete